MTYTWMKMYIDILDDPKMGEMSDALFRNTILIFLIACKNGGTGELPDIKGLAWLMRKEPKEVEEILKALIECRIIEKAEAALPEGGYANKFIVKNYVKRQGPLNFNERQDRVRNGLSRRRDKSVIPTEPDSDQDSELDIDTERDIDIEREADTHTDAETVLCVRNKLSSLHFSLNKKTKQYIHEWLNDFPDVDVVYRAIENAANQGAVSLAYIDRILINWKANGIPLTREEKIRIAQTRNRGKF